MKSLIAILTGLHVLAHGIFGCCNHGLVASSPAAKPCACHRAHHDHHVSPSSSRDVADEQLPSRAPHQCAHSSCHWLTGNAGPSISPPDFSVPVSFVAILPMRGLAMQAAEFRPADILGPSFAPPLRLHLALGVLLI
jgi:hypothetical protein